MNCRKCGSPLQPGALFCQVCGTPVETSNPQQQSPYPQQQYWYPQQGQYPQQQNPNQPQQFNNQGGFQNQNMQNQPPQGYYPAPAPQNNGGGKDTGKIVGIIIAIVLVIAIAAGAALLVHFISKGGIGNKDKTTTETTVTSTVREEEEESTTEPENPKEETSEPKETTTKPETPTKDTGILKKAKKYNEDAEEYEGHAYAIFNYKDNELKDYKDCEKFCEEMGGHLAVINSQEENDFIYDYIGRKGYTLVMFGYSDEKGEGKWKWVNGSKSKYTNWAEGQPNNGANNRSGISENYAEFSKHPANGQWNDTEFGSNTYNFICEWE